jgi:hypothetical protein
VIIVIGKCEELEHILDALKSLERGQRETNRLLKVIAKEEAPPQLASSGATVQTVSP